MSLSRAYEKINNKGNYIRPANGEQYYGFYYWEGSQLSTRYVKTNTIRPQRINIREYMHYRKKLISLMNGDIVGFTGEDRDTSHEASQAQESSGTILQEAFEAEIILTHPDNSATSFLAFVKQPIGDWKTELKTSLADVIKELSAKYVLYQIDNRNGDTISLDGKAWAVENSNVDKGYRQFFYNLVAEIFGTELFADYKQGYKKVKERMDSALLYFHPVNMDFHIEVNANTKLGSLGQYINRDNPVDYLIHLTTFSRNNLMSEDSEVVNITEDKKGPFTDCHENVQKLIDAGIFDEAYFSHLNEQVITEEERINFLLNNLGKTMLTLPNFLTPIKENELENMLNGIHGFGEFGNSQLYDLEHHNSYRILTEALQKEMMQYAIDFTKGRNITYFHPIGLLKWMDRRR